MASPVRLGWTGRKGDETLEENLLYPEYERSAAYAKRVREDSRFIKDIIQKENIKAD